MITVEFVSIFSAPSTAAVCEGFKGVYFSTGTTVGCEKCHHIYTVSASVWEILPPVQMVLFLHQPGNAAQSRLESSEWDPGHWAVPALFHWYGLHRESGRADIRVSGQCQKRRFCQTHPTNPHSSVCLGSQPVECEEVPGEMSWTLHHQRGTAAAAHTQPAENRLSWR